MNISRTQRIEVHVKEHCLPTDIIIQCINVFHEIHGKGDTMNFMLFLYHKTHTDLCNNILEMFTRK